MRLEMIELLAQALARGAILRAKKAATQPHSVAGGGKTPAPGEDRHDGGGVGGHSGRFRGLAQPANGAKQGRDGVQARRSLLVAQAIDRLD